MKIIIDMPEKVVTAIQNGEDYRYDIHTAIAQGMPYEERPKGDLISREALKARLKRNCKPELCHDCGSNWCEYNCPHHDFEELIDNAPTVPPKYFPPCEDCNKKMEEIRQAYDKMKATERPQVTVFAENASKKEIEDFKNELEEVLKIPQGEWVDYSEEGFVECPFCHKATTCEDNIDELHFCWNCGAKLERIMENERGEEV